MLVRITHDLAGLALLQSQMDPLGSDLFVLRQIKQLAQRVLGALRLRTVDPKCIATPADLYVQPGFQQPQIFIQRAAEIGESSIVGGF
jgi:hypothetical protein